MTNQEMIQKISLWQNAGFVHPLTCGKDSRHQNLVPKEVDGKVILYCPDCDYIQDRIPDVALTLKKCPQCGTAIPSGNIYCWRCEYFD